MKRYLPIAAFALVCACGPRIRDRARIPEPPVVPQAPPHDAPALATPAKTVPIPNVIVDPPPPPPPTRPGPRTIDDVIVSTNADLLDAFFPYERSDLSREAIDALRKDAAILRPLLWEFPRLRVTVEGHCDERGSAEYNLGLGDHRARRASALLEQFGIPAERIETISYGKEAPQCTEPVEACWSRNRRAHLSIQSLDTRHQSGTGQWARVTF